MRVDRPQDETQRDDAKDRTRDRSEAVISLEQEDPRHQCDTQHRQRDEQHDADREASIRKPRQEQNILVVVTHSADLAQLFERKMEMADGALHGVEGRP